MSLQIILVLGVSGAGKNVALGALEDVGFAIVNNLPAALLFDTVKAMLATHSQSLGISINAHSPDFVTAFNAGVEAIALAHAEIPLRVIRIDASESTLLRRFAETRRRHPFASDTSTLHDAIAEERGRLLQVAATACDMDTSATSTHLLRQRVRRFAAAMDTQTDLPLVEISSFAYREGIPPDADLVFDARILPNPFYEPGLALLTGRDAPVADYLRAQPEVDEMLGQIEAFIARWLPAFENDQRSYLTVAIGCTGGQHRSVYFVQTLAERFRMRAATLARHRELDAR